jgi:hypothetical protein
LIVFLFVATTLFSQEIKSNIITSDINNFWVAYDKIITTKDSAAQAEYLQKLFIEKGSPGLKAIMEVRDYTVGSYLEAIKLYPQFWNSIRSNTQRAVDFAKDIEADIQKIKDIYPSLQPAKIYFTIGALLTGGTTMNGIVLIGSEIALADSTTITSEFSQGMGHLAPYFKTNPIKNVAFGNTHEYIHTQQKTTIANNLLAQSVLEGVAEFVAVLATGKTSTAPAIVEGPANADRIRDFFSKQLYNTFNGFWLYSNASNEFNLRDLGYYTGYAICESYYKKSADKKAAIKEMIQLDYNNEEAVMRFVDRSGYFSLPLSAIKKQFEYDRPKVVKVDGLTNGGKNIKPGKKQIVVHFSKPMNDRYRDFELGPLGMDNLLRVQNFIGFSADKRSMTFEVETIANRHYQLVINSGFRSDETYSRSLKPYLIEFWTGE